MLALAGRGELLDPVDADPIVQRFRDHIAEVHRQHGGRPREELDALLLVGIEREAIVTVSYRADIIAERLGRMPLDPAVREVVARAIRWAWRDEEAHTLWVRGALMRRSELSWRARALAAQVGGWIGGYTVSWQAHHAWRESPGRRLVAEALEVAGAAAGRIPPEVRARLQYEPFRRVCLFNRAAETTAMLGWQRIAELAAMEEVGSAESAEAAEAAGFLHLAQDEARHARLFELLAEAFDEQDRCLVDAPTLAGRLATVGQRFVAAPTPGAAAWANPLGKGGPVVVREGGDVDRLVEATLQGAGVDALLQARRPADRPLRVALKTTMMMVTTARDRSPGVSARVLQALVGALRARGAVVDVLDAANLYDRFHEGRSVAEVTRYLGLSLPVADAQQEQVPHHYLRGIGEDTVSRTWQEADARILLGKLRSHPTARVLASLEAAEGLGARHDDLMFADRRAERETAILMVLDAFPADLAVVDAWEEVPDGLMGAFGCEAPHHPRRLYASRDAVAVDAVVARHTGIGAGQEPALLRQAFDWFGRPEVRVDGPDAPIVGFRLPDHRRRTAMLARLARPAWVHAGLRGELFLPEFDEVAFPPKVRSRAMTAARAAIRRVVVDRGPKRWPR